MLGIRIPKRLLHDHRLRLFPRPMQPVEIGLMVERIATGPPDQLDVGIGVGTTVIVELRAGPLQHLGQPSYGNKVGDRVAKLAEGGP